jgi:hypothetical protein
MAKREKRWMLGPVDFGIPVTVQFRPGGTCERGLLRLRYRGTAEDGDGEIGVTITVREANVSRTCASDAVHKVYGARSHLQFLENLIRDAINQGYPIASDEEENEEPDHTITDMMRHVLDEGRDEGGAR